MNNWTEVDKNGFIMSGFVQTDNALIREIIHMTNIQCAAMYGIILSHRNTETDKCFPSYALLANETNQSIATVKRQTSQLYEKGFIVINSGKQGIANTYYFPREKFYKGSDESGMAKRRKNAMSLEVDKQIKKKKKLINKS